MIQEFRLKIDGRILDALHVEAKRRGVSVNRLATEALSATVPAKMSFAQAAAMMNITRQSVRELALRGRLGAVNRSDGNVTVTRKGVLKYLESKGK